VSHCTGTKNLTRGGSQEGSEPLYWDQEPHQRGEQEGGEPLYWDQEPHQRGEQEGSEPLYWDQEPHQRGREGVRRQGVGREGVVRRRGFRNCASWHLQSSTLLYCTVELSSVLRSGHGCTWQKTKALKMMVLRVGVAVLRCGAGQAGPGRGREHQEDGHLVRWP